MLPARRIFASLLFAFVALAIAPAFAADRIVDASSTPRRYVAAFLQAAEAGDWTKAAALLGNPGPSARNDEAAERARELDYLLEKRSWIRLDTISDEPNGTPEDGDLVERIGIVRIDDGEFPIMLERTKTTPPRWSFSADTLARVPQVYAQRGPSLMESRVPTSLRTSFAGLEAWQWIGLPLTIVLALLLGRVVSFLLRALGRVIARRTAARWDDELVEAVHGPLRLFVVCVCYAVLSYGLGLPGAIHVVSFHIVLTLAMTSMIWLVLRSVDVLADLFERRALGVDARTTLAEHHARGTRTRVQVLRRVASVSVIVVGVAALLTQFAVVRSVGMSLLASAGVAGVVLGLAAQRPIGSLLAGLQLSITQPLRIGDIVVIEGEFGTIEDLTLTYVTMKIWDERRLVLPITRLLEQPFQNLTRVKSGQLGAVMLYAGWTLPVDALRKELDRILGTLPKWDGRMKSVQITDTREQAIEIRVLVSASDPQEIFDLRAAVRERLVTWLRTFEGGAHLAQLRISKDARESASP